MIATTNTPNAKLQASVVLGFIVLLFFLGGTIAFFFGTDSREKFRRDVRKEIVARGYQCSLVEGLEHIGVSHDGRIWLARCVEQGVEREVQILTYRVAFGETRLKVRPW